VELGQHELDRVAQPRRRDRAAQRGERMARRDHRHHLDRGQHLALEAWRHAQRASWQPWDDFTRPATELRLRHEYGIEPHM